ncbi:MAG: putative serine protease HtrA [Pseudomonadota bacterium]|jgi:S1-C subfamily serine protease
MHPYKYCNALNYLPISNNISRLITALKTPSVRILAVLAFVTSASSGASVFAQSAAIQTNREVTAQIMQSVVMVEATARTTMPSTQTLGPLRVGSGIVIARDTVVTVGYLLIEAETADIVDNQGRRIPATIIGHDPISGFGLIKSLLPLQSTPVALGDSDLLSVPQRLLTLGHSEPEPTELLLASRKLFAGSWEYLVESPLLTIPAVNNWSGAGLFDEKGALVGLGSLLVADATDEPRARPGNLYLPINIFKPVLGDLLKFGRRSGPVQAWLGIHSQPHPQGGLLIQRVSARSPAERAGLEPGDRILALDNRAVLDLPDFYRRIWASGPIGSAVTLSVVRQGATRQVTLQTGDRLAAQQRPSGV